MFTTRSPCRPAPVIDAASAPGDDPPTDLGLLLVAHGSRKGDVAAERMTRRHAAALVERGVCAEAASATLFGGPGPAEALERMQSRSVLVVPMFMSDGHYVRDVLPGALAENGGAGPTSARSVGFSLAVGLEPELAGLIVSRAHEAFASRRVNAGDGNLLLIGHGSRQDPASRRAVEGQARRVQTAFRFRAVKTCFLEEPPTLENTLAELTGPVVADALFASQGLHAGHDIADAIRARGDGDITYLGAIGEDARMVDVIAAGATRAVGSVVVGS